MDPNGDTIGHVDEAIQKKIDALTDKSSEDYSRSFSRLYKRLEKSKIVYNFYEATAEQVQDNVKGTTTKNINGSIDIYSSSFDMVRTSPQGGFSKEYALLFEEIYHAGDYDKGRLDLSHPTCRDEARAWKFSAKAPGTNMRWTHSDKNGKYNDYTFAYALRHSSIYFITKGFKNGFENYIDANNNEHFFMNGDKGGLYNHLNIR